MIEYRDRVIQENEPDCMHYHDVYELILIDQSRSTCFVADRSYHFEDRSLLLIPPRRLHTIHYLAGTSYVMYIVNFSDTFIRDSLAALGAPGLLETLGGEACHAVQLSQTRFQRLRALFQALYAAGKDPDRQSLSRGYLGVILLEAAGDFRNMRLSRTVQCRGDELARAVVRYVDAHFDRKITLEAMAEALFVSKYHLCHAFSQATGTGIVNYIQCRRVLEAQKLLMKGELTNQQISLRCGFENTQHFYRVFKKITGQVPGNYRMPVL